MDILQIFKIIAAAATAAIGLLAFLMPTRIDGFTGLKGDSPRAVSEIRSVVGGLFLTLGLLPFFLPGAYLFLGITYLGIAAARAFSILADRSYAPSNLISLLSEIILAAILIA